MENDDLFHMEQKVISTKIKNRKKFTSLHENVPSSKVGYLNSFILILYFVGILYFM